MRVLSALVFVLACRAQVTSGSISGFVLDPSDRPIAAAKVSVTGQALDQTTLTDDSGFYRIATVKPGTYRVSASADRFSPARVTVAVAVHASQRVDLKLMLAVVEQSVEVLGVARVVQSETSDLGAVIDTDSMAGLPLNRRDFLQLALLIPGVAPPAEGSQLSQRQSFAMHANGAREESNNFLLDGVDNNDPDTNRYALQPPVDAIQEFQIATNGYNAEYGRNAGAQVNVVTRSGSNDVHGFAYEYFRNRHLDARNYFSGAEGKPQFVRNQFGAGAGGPLRRDRTFVFGNWDGLRERRGLPRLATVPTAAMRRGDLAEVAGTPVDPFTRQPFPNKTVPVSRIHPLAGRVMSLFPLPNLPGTSGNLLSQPVFEGDQTQWNARLDHRLDDRSLLTARYSHGANRLFEPFAPETASIPGFGDNVRDRSHNALLQWQRLIAPSLNVSVIAGFNRVERSIVQQGASTDVNREWGVNWLPRNPIDFGYPTFNIAGFSSLGDATQIPIVRAGNTYQLTNNLLWLAGRHAIKFGVELRHNQHNGINNLLTRGTLTFSGAVSGTGASDALLGFPALGIQAQADNVQTLRTTAYNGFLHDDWKVHPRLTVNLGLRYEYNSPPTDPHDRMSVLDVARGSIARVGTGGISRSGFRPDRNNAAPRVGFAWSPRDTTVVRAAYGVFYDAGLVVANTALYFNPPFFTIRVFFPTQTSLLTLNDPFPLRGGITPAASLSSLSPDLKTGYLQHWNFNIQREAARGVVSLAYTGSKGTGLLRSRDLNQPAPGPGDLAARRPLPAFANIFYMESGANSNYHSFQAFYNRPLIRRFSMLAAFTLSKSIDDASGFLGTRVDKNFPQDSRNYRAERALSSFDQRHRVSIAGVAKLPAGLQASVLGSAASGQPLTPILRFDNSNTGNSGGQFGNDRPHLLHDPNLSHQTVDAWFDASAFAVPARYTFGSAGRNIVRGPGFSTVDVSLLRRFQLKDRLALQMEAQAFNLFNRSNFDMPERFADEPSSFGRIFSAKAPRQLQFNARLTF